MARSRIVGKCALALVLFGSIVPCLVQAADPRRAERPAVLRLETVSSDGPSVGVGRVIRFLRATAWLGRRGMPGAILFTPYVILEDPDPITREEGEEDEASESDGVGEITF